MDKDKIIGGVLAIGLFISYVVYSQKRQKQIQDNSQQTVAVAEKKFDNYNSDFGKKNFESVKEEEVSLKDTFFYDKFATAKTSEKISLENKDLKIVFDNNGGRIYDVILKNEVDKDNNPVQLISGKNGASGFCFKYQDNLINTNDLVFTVDKENSDEKRISFVCDLGEGKIIKQVYRLDDEGFVVDHRWNFFNINQYFDSNEINFVWNNVLLNQEKDRDYCSKKTTINYLTSDNKFDGFNEYSPKPQSAQIASLKWVAMRQRFFTIGIDGLNSFRNTSLTLTPNNDKRFLKNVDVFAQISEPNGVSLKDMSGDIHYYFGPNNYSDLKKFAFKFDKNLYLGGFIVRPINEYCFLPVINFLHNHIGDLILLIFLLALVVKLLILPFTLKSNIAMAEMRLLNPTLTLLQEKYKDQPEVLQLEQMKLYQEMGVSPLGGCLPILLQMPILFAMYHLIPNLTFFRNQSFLWVQDWSSFDSLFTLPFNIPLYGNHVSLFALLMAASSVIFSLANSTPSSSDQMKTQMKFMNYFLPITFLLVGNSFPAALNLYYLISNLISVLQQYFTSKFLNDDKIKKKLEERRMKIKNSGSSFNKKIQQIIDMQKKSN